MAREQRIVARDFLGLRSNTGCKMGSENLGHPEMSTEDRRENHYFSAIAALETPPSHLLPDESNATTFARPRTTFDQHTMDFLSKGMKLPVWSNAITVQQLLSLRNSHDKRFAESTQNDPDRLGSHLLHPHMQEFFNNNQGHALRSQLTGHHGDNRIMQTKDFPTRENHEADSQFVGQGTVPKTMLSLSSSNLKERVLSNPALRAQAVTTVDSDVSSLLRSVGKLPLGSYLPVPLVGGFPAGTQTSMLSSDPSGKQSGAQLTIFYAGNVNVYDEISVEKAQEIMHFAGSGNSMPRNGLRSPAGQYAPQALLNAIISQTIAGSLQHGDTVSVNPPEKLQQNIAGSKPAAVQVSQCSPPANKMPECLKPDTPSSASSSLPAGQPVVPRPLPQARKASLARFLERRRERVQSKSPFFLKKHSLERSILPGERFSSSNYGTVPSTRLEECADNKPMPMDCGMEEMTGTFEYASPCDMTSNTELSAAESHVAAEGEPTVSSIG